METDSFVDSKDCYCQASVTTFPTPEQLPGCLCLFLKWVQMCSDRHLFPAMLIPERLLLGDDLKSHALAESRRVTQSEISGQVVVLVLHTNSTDVQVVLVFTEGILIAQYVYQIPTRLHCELVGPDLRQKAELVGIHGAGLRSIPIFCVYLATLMHTYQLTRHQVSLLYPSAASGYFHSYIFCRAVLVEPLLSQDTSQHTNCS